MFTQGDVDKVLAYAAERHDGFKDQHATLVDSSMVPLIVEAASRTEVLKDIVSAVRTEHGDILFMYHPKGTALSVASRAVKDWEMKLPSVGRDAVVRVLGAAYAHIGLIKQDMKALKP